MIAFHNGTFANVALVEADAIYPTWVIQSLHDALYHQDYGYLNTDERNQVTESSDDRLVGLLHQITSSVRILFTGLRGSKPTTESANSPEMTIPEQSALQSLVSVLKDKDRRLSRGHCHPHNAHFSGLLQRHPEAPALSCSRSRIYSVDSVLWHRKLRQRGNACPTTCPIPLQPPKFYIYDRVHIWPIRHRRNH